jgi:hypothetical protein
MQASTETLTEAPARPQRLLADYFTEPQLADEIDRTTRTLRHWRKNRVGPPWTEIGGTVVYRCEAVRKWLLEQERQPVRSRQR